MAHTSPQIDAACHCGKCQNAVKVQGPAKGGKFPGQYYLHCFNCHWHYTFPDGLAPRAALPIAPNPSTSQQVTLKKAPSSCSGKTCGRNANASCPNRCCRTCCIIKGGSGSGCRVTEAHLSKNGRQKFIKLTLPSFNPEPLPSFNRGPSPSQHVFGPPPTVDEYAASIIDADPFLQMVKRSEHQDAEARRRAEEEAELDRQEQEQIDAVIAASLETVAACDMYSPPREAQPVASSSRQQATHTLHSPTTASQPSSTVFISGIPVTKVNEVNKPKITTQMNTHWMRPYQDRTSQPQVIVSTSARRGQLDAELVQRFRIIWWEQDDVDPAIFPVQECPQWPKWKISDCPDVVQRLGKGPIDFYDQEYKFWMECPLSYSHTMKSDGYLLLRRHGVHCHDFTKHFSTATRIPSSSRVYMSSVRKSLHVRSNRLKRRGRGQTTDIEDESEGEVEIVEDSPPPKHKRVKSESMEPMRPILPRLTIPLTPSGLSLESPISLPDTPPLVSESATSADSTSSFFPLSQPPPTSPIPSAVASPSPTPRSSIPVMGPPPLIENGHSWPYNMYVVDIDAGFRKMKALQRARHGKYTERFIAAFDQPVPVTSTYYDQLNKWKDAPEAIRNTCLAAIRTQEGEWGHFVNLVNASTKK